MVIHAGKHGHTVNWDKMDIQARTLEISFSGHMVIAFRKVIFYSESTAQSVSGLDCGKKTRETFLWDTRYIVILAEQQGGGVITSYYRECKPD